MIKDLCELGKGSFVYDYLLNNTIRELKFSEEDYNLELPSIRSRLRVVIYWSDTNFNNSWYFNHFKPIFKVEDLKTEYYFIDIDQFVGILVEGKSSLLYELIHTKSLRHSSLSFLLNFRDDFVSKELVESYIDFIYREELKDRKNQSPILERYISLLLLFKLVNESYDLRVGDINLPKTNISLNKASKLILKNNLGKEIFTMNKILDNKDSVMERVTISNKKVRLTDVDQMDVFEQEIKRSILQKIERSIEGIKEEQLLNKSTTDAITTSMIFDLQSLKIRRVNIFL